MTAYSVPGTNPRVIIGTGNSDRPQRAESGERYFDVQSGSWKVWNGDHVSGSWVEHYEGVISPLEVPRLPIIPEVGGVPTGKLIKNTNAASSSIIGFRYTIAPGDPIVAGARLAEQLDDTWMLSAGWGVTHRVVSSVAFSVYVACVANVEYNNAAGTILPTGTTEANTRTAMTKLDYPATTKYIELLAHDVYDIASKSQGLLEVGGYEDA